MRTALCLSVLALATLAVAPTGCAASSSDEEEASATTTSALQAQSQVGLTDGVLDIEGGLAPAPEDAARAVSDGPLRGLRPAGCATKARDGAVVTLTLDHCTGPFGKVVLVGTLVATFSKTAADTLHVDIAAGDGTTANDRALTYAGHADVRYDGAQRFVTYSGDSSGTTKRGKDFSRHTELYVVADVDTHCARIDGTSKGAIGKYEVDLSIDGFQGCRDACPTAGHARATVDGPLVKNASIDVTFDGSSQAHVATHIRKTTQRDVALDCDAAEAAE